MLKNTYNFLFKVIFIALAIVLVFNIMFYNTSKNTINLATKNFTEQKILVYAIQDVIEATTDYEVNIITGMDATNILNESLKKGDIDMYVEYSSSAFIEIYKHLFEGQTSQEIIDTITQDYANDNISFNTLLGFENSNAIICGSYCSDNNITKLSQVDPDAELKFGAPIYFYQRSDGMNLLYDAYGFNNIEEVNLDSSLTYTAINNDEVDLGLSFTTDANLATGDYLILEDDKLSFPSYDAAIIVNQDTLEDFPELQDALDLFDHAISTEAMQNYNLMAIDDENNLKEVGQTIADDVLKQ